MDGIAGGFFTNWAMREAYLYIYILKESALMTLDFSMKLILDFCSPEL